MASTSFVLDLVNMVEICAHGLGIPLLLPVDDFGLAAVSSIRLSIRFKLLASSIWIERELLDPVTLQISHTITELSTHSEDGSILWNLCSGRCRVYGVADSEMPSSTDVLPSSHSFTHTFSTPRIVLIKVELVLDPVINLSDSSDDDRCVLPEVDPSSQAPFASPVSLHVDFQIPTSAVPKSSVRQPHSIVDSLCKLANMPSSKNVLRSWTMIVSELCMLNSCPLTLTVMSCMSSLQLVTQLYTPRPYLWMEWISAMTVMFGPRL